MSEIFISYSHEDRERAKQLAEALQSKGWSVWWDRNIPFGKPFDDVIAEALAAARCVIALWSKESVRSHWVRSEASEGAARDVLVPIRLDSEAEIPLEFKRLQTADLSDWEPGVAHHEFDLLLDRIKDLVSAGRASEPPGATAEQGAGEVPRPVTAPAGGAGRSATPPTVPASGGDNVPAAAPYPPGHRRALAVTSFIVLPTVLVAGAALMLMAWRVPTSINVNLVVDRVEFRVAGANGIRVLDSAPSFRRLVVESFSRIALRPATGSLEVPSTGAGERAGWRSGPATDEIVLQGDAARNSKVTFTSPTEQTEAAGRISDIKVVPGALVIAEASPGALRLTLTGQLLTATVLPGSQLEVTAENASTVPQVREFSEANQIRFRVTLHPADPMLQIESLPDELKLGVWLATEAPVELVPATQVSAIAVRRVGAENKVEPALRGEGTMSYPGYEGKGVVRFPEQELPAFRALEDTEITKLRFNPQTGTMELTFKAVWSKSPEENEADHRLTHFDKLWYGSKPALIFSVCAWIFSLVIGLYKLYAR